MAICRNLIAISASCLLSSGDRRRAEAAFREAIRIQPDYADAHGNLANLLAGKGDLTNARRHFETALRFKPKDAAVRYNFAVALGRARDVRRRAAAIAGGAGV